MTRCAASSAKGVEVILIEPGGVKTPIWDKSNEMADQIQRRCRPRPSGSTEG